MRKGSHTVEGFLNWLRYSNVHPPTKVRLAREIRRMADICSATGKQALLKFTQPAQDGRHVVMAIRVFEDGSLSLGYPGDARWYGTKEPQFIPPPEEEL